MRIRNFIFGIFLGALGYLCIQTTPNDHFVSLVKEVKPKVVMINVDTVLEQLVLRNDNGQFSIDRATLPVTIKGAGVFVSAQGHILTCAHLFQFSPIRAIQVELSNGEKVHGTLLYKEESPDLAFVKIEVGRPTPYAHLSHRRLKIGQEIVAIGNPMGLAFTVTNGIISMVNRDLEEPYIYTQISAAINPGNSGGPIFNQQGELIGITALKGDGEGLGFAITPQTIENFLRLFKGL